MQRDRAWPSWHKGQNASTQLEVTKGWYRKIYHDHNHDSTLTLEVDHSYSPKTENIFKDYYYYAVCFPEGRIYQMQGCKL